MATARRQEKRPEGFDFTLHMQRVCEDLTDRLDELRHIDLSRVAISFSQTRSRTLYGMYASLTPMRFAGGKTHTVRQGQRCTIQRLFGPSGREMLYILNFYLPRFFQLGFHEKLTTILHELWHISPEFNGDVRRYQGRCYAHSRSGNHDRQAERLARKWLSQRPPESLYAFLKLDFRQLQKQYGHVIGVRVFTPKILPVDE
jgi:predicted metallopeptidase